MVFLHSRWLETIAISGVIAYGSYKLIDTFLINKNKTIKNKTILITGAGSGVGRLLSLKLARSGNHLILWDIQTDKLKELENEIKIIYKTLYPELNYIVKIYTIDITDHIKVYSTAMDIKEKTNLNINILINNAGIVNGLKLLDKKSNDEKMIRVMQVNTISHFWTIKAFLPTMIENNDGHIVTIASMAGITGVAGLVDYCASKFGSVGIHQSLRMELRTIKNANNVFATCICPFYIDTGMFEGVYSKFNYLLPILKPEYVCNRIINAIIQKENIIYMPFIASLTPILTAILPTKICDYLADFFGTNQSMENFIQTRNI